MKDCLFCKIVAGEIPSAKVYEDEFVIGFRDIEPQAPVHILLVPKAHIESLAATDESQEALLGHCLAVAAKLGREIEGGFRVVTNSGANAGQTVPHLHFPLLGGTRLDDKHSFYRMPDRLVFMDEPILIGWTIQHCALTCCANLS